MTYPSVAASEMRHGAGFTLIEVLITVVIIGILASIAVPSYTDYVRRAKVQEATSELANLRVKLEQYYQDQRSYIGYVDAGCVRAGNALASGRHFTFTCGFDADEPNEYLLTATGVATQGMGGYVYTLNQNNARTTTIAGTTVNCWINKQGETC